MLPLALCFVLFGGELMDLFRPSGDRGDFTPVRATGVVLLYYVAVYSLADSFNLIYFGALKGAGDTLFIMLIHGGMAVFGLIAPIMVLEFLRLDTLHSLWRMFAAYVILLALLVWARYKSRRWHHIRMIEL
jgi:MATE family multidrug resistance protein